jgi:hypothetical protein
MEVQIFSRALLLYMRYFLGLIMVGIGVLLIIKTEWFVQNFGSNAWAEEHLGTSGGTRLMYKLIGIVFIFFGFLAITNLLSGFLLGTVGAIFIR